MKVIKDYVDNLYDNPTDKAKFLARVLDPHSNWQTMESPKFLQHLRNTGHETFAVNEGGVQNIGDEFNAPIEIDSIASTKFEAPVKGNQRVKFANQYNLLLGHTDVVEIEYDQSFNGGKAAGWRAWHARGVGIIQINWRYDGKDVGGTIPATVSVVKGKIVNKYPVLT